MWPHLLSIETWRIVGLFSNILTWLFGIFAIISAIVAYLAQSNMEILKNAPRELTTGQREQIAVPLKPTPADSLAQEQSKTADEVARSQQPSRIQSTGILLISIGGDESEAYAAQLANVLAKNFRIARFSIESMPNAPTGMSYLPNGNDPKPLLTYLEKAGLRASPSALPMLPIPLSIQSQYSRFVALIIGPKGAD